MGANGSRDAKIEEDNVEAYKAHQSLKVVITWGTNGIGEAMAVKLASLIAEPYIIIVGRNQVSLQTYSSIPTVLSIAHSHWRATSRA